MVSTDDTFPSTLRSEYDRVCEAAEDYGEMEGMVGFVMFQKTWDTCFEPLTHASASDADANARAWDRSVIYHLAGVADAEFGSQRSAWTLGTGWDGPASEQFRLYCGKLEGPPATVGVR
jgi:hypothetical protein